MSDNDYTFNEETRQRDAWLRPASLGVMILAAGCGESGVSDAARLEVLIEQIDATRIEAGIPGLAVGVLQNGELLALRGLGFADLETGRPVTPDTPFNLASVTKPISAVLALRLQEEGLLDLDAPMSGYRDFNGFCADARERGGLFFDDWACNDPDITLTNYSRFLADHPPQAQVEIAPDTSWSCAHGVERWRSDCGCGPESSTWRTPLRAALDWLRDRLQVEYEERAGKLLNDPWAARSAYIDVLLDDSAAARERFLERNVRDSRGARAWDEIRKLLEMQRHAMLMYTSCGWFFDDLARIETIQIMRYAGRAVELAREISGEDPEPEFLDRLKAARSNREDAATGRDLYERHVIRREPVD